MKAESEAGFTAAVLEMAKLFGWRTAHFRPGMNRRGKWQTAVQGDGVGFPDLILLRKYEGIAAELKMVGKKPTADQIVWLDAFRAAHFRVFVWTPENWDYIEAVLR